MNNGEWSRLDGVEEQVRTYQNCELLLQVTASPKGVYEYEVYDSHDPRDAVLKGLAYTLDGAKSCAETQADILAESGFASNR